MDLLETLRINAKGNVSEECADSALTYIAYNDDLFQYFEGRVHTPDERLEFAELVCRLGLAGLNEKPTASFMYERLCQFSEQGIEALLDHYEGLDGKPEEILRSMEGEFHAAIAGSASALMTGFISISLDTAEADYAREEAKRAASRWGERSYFSAMESGSVLEAVDEGRAAHAYGFASNMAVMMLNITGKSKWAYHCLQSMTSKAEMRENYDMPAAIQQYQTAAEYVKDHKDDFGEDWKELRGEMVTKVGSAESCQAEEEAEEASEALRREKV